MTREAVVVEHARIVRDRHVILPDLSMQMTTGGIYGLVGPSGSGKTTVIRAMLGLTPVSSGAITVLGLPAGSPRLRQQIGYMPQGEGVYPDLTGRENLSFFAGIYRVSRERVEELLAMLGLDDIANRRVDTYSGGQRQRVGLAIALLHKPPLMILDEPTIGLDPRLRHRLWMMFRAWADAGTTLIVSTHVMGEAQQCDKIAFLLDGHLAAFGTPNDLMTLSGTTDMDEAALVLSEREVRDVD